MKIEVFEVMSKEDKVYQELLEQYKINPELQALLDENFIRSEFIGPIGDFRLITTLNTVIGKDSIKIYLVKDVDNDTFLWVIGLFVDDGEKSMYPLSKEQSEELLLEIESVLIEKGLIKEPTNNIG